MKAGRQPWIPAGEPGLRIRPAWYWRTFLPFALAGCLLGLIASNDGGDRAIWGLLAAIFLYEVLVAWTTTVEIFGWTLTRRRFGRSSRRISLNALEYAELFHSRNGWWLDLKDLSGSKISIWRNAWKPEDWERLYGAAMAGAPPRRTLLQKFGSPVRAATRILLIWIVVMAIYGLSNVGWNVGRIVEVLPELGFVTGVQLVVFAVYWTFAVYFEKKHGDTPYPGSWDERIFSRFRWWFH
ncbi:MAG: hypothetical protein WD178_02900 [Actinomycetota bacterium]